MPGPPTYLRNPTFGFNSSALLRFVARPRSGRPREDHTGAAIDNAFGEAEDRALDEERRDQLGVTRATIARVGRVLFVDERPKALESLSGKEPGEKPRDNPYRSKDQLHANRLPLFGISQSGDSAVYRDLRVMSPNLESRWTTWGTVSSGFREIEIGWDLWGFLPHFLPQPRAHRRETAVKAPLAVAQSDSAHPSSITPKRSRRIAVTTAETSSEPPQPSLLEKKMNMTIGWSERERRSRHRRGAPTRGIPPRRLTGPD